MLKPGTILDDRYEIIDVVGTGGMSTVYRAKDERLKRFVAIKVLKSDYSSDQNFVSKFRAEAQSSAGLTHPNIVSVYDVCEDDGRYFIVMELVEGITLKEYINLNGRLNMTQAIDFSIQIASGLEAAHEHHVIHRDIKPQNIIVSKSGNIKVTDFGIAKAATSTTMSTTGIGSVHYISPEQARGDITDERTDIYSIGVLLYEMLTGTLPFKADNAVSVAIMQLQRRPRPLREINSEIPEGLEQITLKAMQKDSEFRFKNTNDMLEALSEFKKNPSIKFEYKYFSTSDEPTRYLKVVDSIKASKRMENSRNIERVDNLKKKKKVSKPLSVAIGIGISVLVFAAILVIGLLTGWFGLSGKDVDVPNFIGLRASDIIDGNNYKFKWNIEYAYDSLKPEGIVIDQDPKAGSKKIKENAEVKLVVNSSGAMIKVPNLKGKTEDAAKSILKDAGFIYEILYVEDAETAKGVVIGTDPDPGKEVAVSSNIKLFVSKGPASKNVIVPNVVGKSINDATSELSEKGLKVSSNINREKSEKPKDTVITINPLPGTEVKEGSSVSLTVSSGEAVQKNVSISVDLPTDMDRDVSLSVYVSGELYLSKTIRPSLIGNYTVTVSGTSGKKSVVVNLDNKIYRRYEIDFDAQNVHKTESYNVTNTSVNKTNAKTKPAVLKIKNKNS